MVFIALVIPLFLMGLTLVMERVEQPLREEAVSEEIAQWLEHAAPEDIESFVSNGLSRPINRYWRRSGGGARLRGRRTTRD